MSTRREFVKVTALVAGAVALGIDTRERLLLLVGDGALGDIRVWLNGIECGGDIRIAYAPAFRAARDGESLAFDIWVRNAKGNCYGDPTTGNLAVRQVHALVVSRLDAPTGYKNLGGFLAWPPAPPTPRVAAWLREHGVTA